MFFFFFFFFFFFAKACTADIFKGMIIVNISAHTFKETSLPEDFHTRLVTGDETSPLGTRYLKRVEGLLNIFFTFLINFGLLNIFLHF